MIREIIVVYRKIIMYDNRHAKTQYRYDNRYGNNIGIVYDAYVDG
jgi:hypothetical protein